MIRKILCYALLLFSAIAAEAQGALLYDKILTAGSGQGGPINVQFGELAGMSNYTLQFSPVSGSRITTCQVALDNDLPAWTYAGAIGVQDCSASGRADNSAAVAANNVRVDYAIAGTGQVHIQLWGCLGPCAASVSDAGAVQLAPSGDQLLVGQWDLINDGGGFAVIDTGATPSDVDLGLRVIGGGQAGLFYTRTGINARLLFNPNGAIVMNPVVGGADDGGNGVIINNSGLFIASAFSDGMSLSLNGGALIAGGRHPSGSPVVTLGSIGVEGVILAQGGSSGPGTYTLRFPSAGADSVVSYPPNLTGQLLVETTVPASATAAGVAGQYASDTNFFYRCTATNTWKRVALASW